MLEEILFILYWWGVLAGIGFLFLPLTGKIFEKFIDRGYIFSKVIGIAVLSFLSWFFASIEILPFSQWSIYLILGLMIFVFIWRKSYLTAWKVVRKKLVFIIVGEILFLGIFGFWAYLRGINPDIQSVEKFMDFGFINAAYRAKWMPPVDMWYAGETINYYYYGHFVTAYLAKLTGVSTSIVFNLMLATIVGLTFGLAFSFALNLFYFWRKDAKIAGIAGLISGLVITFGGTLHTFVFTTLLPIAKKIGWYGGEIKTYWYADATRYIGYHPPTNDKTIHEFPNYIFAVGDLHAHVLDIIFVLTIMGLIIAIGVKKDDFSSERARIRAIPKEYVLMGLLLAISAMTNTWDYPIYLGLAGIVLFVRCKQRFKFYDAAFYTIIAWLKIVAISIILSLPYWWHLKNMTQGLGLVTHRTLWYQVAVIYGMPGILAIIFSGIVLTGWLLGRRKKTKEKIAEVDILVMVFAIWAMLLVLAPEVIYVKDIFINGYPRANTMFKLTFQANIIFMSLSGFLAIRIIEAARKIWVKIAVGIVVLGWVVPVFWYPFYSIPGYYGEVKLKSFKGLDGMKYLEAKSPEDYKMINWLNQNVKGQTPILEADGDSYTDYDRISMATGLPTIRGWLVHEWLWRNSYDKQVARAEEVKEVYEGKDVDKTNKILKKYQVKYIIIGELEEEKYATINMAKLQKIGKIVFSAGSGKIIQIRD